MQTSLLAAAAVLLVSSCASQGEAPSTAEHAPVPVVSPGVGDLAFLSGRWMGQAFGGVAEEVWNPPLGGQMLGTFRLVNDGEPNFSEHMLFLPTEEGVVLRLKHFHPNLEGWEEKDESLDFKLQEVRGTTARFEGLTFEVVGEELTISLTMESADGPRVETMRFRRVEH